jgi:tetratricopeptide (TPR) repeat protein
VRWPPTRRGSVGPPPLDPSRAAEALDAAVDREQVFAILMRAARSRLRYAAIVSVHAEALRGRRAMGEKPFDCQLIDELRVPRGAVPALEEAIATGFPYIGAILTGQPAHDEALLRLGGVLPTAAMVIPLLIEDRVVALLVGHDGEEPLTLDDVSELFPVATAGGIALVRLVASRADAAAQKPGRRAETTGFDAGSDEVIAYRRVLEIYRQYESWEEAADALRFLIRTGMEEGDPDEDEQLELLFELGTIEADRLDRPELAVEAWRSALTIDGGDRRILDALERTLVARQEWSEVIELLERRAALADALPERIGLLLNAAAFAREQLGDEERAVEAYERILGWQPDHTLAGNELEELYRLRGQWQPLAARLVDLASQHEETRERVAALEMAAEIYQEKLGDAGAAFLVWMAVLRREPERSDLIEELDRLGPAAGAWDELLPECEGLAEELEPEHPMVAARLWNQIARWHRDHRGAADAAAAALDRSVRLDPDDAEALSDLIELLRASGAWTELAAALARRAELELDPVQRGELYAELARVHDEQLGSPADAARFYDRAAAADPGCRPALLALRRLHRERGAWDALAELLRRHIDTLAGAAPRDELAADHRELGEVLAEHLGRPEDAVHAFQTALELQPRDAAALHGLKQVYRATGQLDAHLDLLEAELDAIGTPAEAHRYADVAVEREARGQVDRAAAVWQKLLAIDPRNPAAHEGLAGALRQLGRWDDLAAACRLRLTVSDRASERAAILLQLASALEAGPGDVAAAIRACEDAVAADGDHPGAAPALARLYERAGRWRDALELIERLRSAAADDRARAELDRRVGSIQASRGDLPAALARLEQAVALDPDNAAAHEDLARVHRDQGDVARAVHHLGRAAQQAPSPADAIRYLLQAAALHRSASEPDRAGDCLERILELEPAHAEATEELTDLLASAGKWEALWPHLERMVDRATSDPDLPAQERKDLFTRAARCAAEIGQAGKASELLELVLAMDPSDARVQLARADALFRAKSWEEAARAYQGLVVQHGSDLEVAARADAYRRLGFVHRQLGRAQQAVVFYQKALELDRGHREAFEELAELELERGRVDEAIANLRALAEAVPPADRPAILERIGDLNREQRSNPARAASIYLEAAELDPGNHRVLQKLLDVQSEAGQWSYALDTIGRFATLEEEPARRGKYFLAAAAIRRAKLQDTAGALDDYERALAAFFAGGGALDPATRTRALEAFQGIDEVLTSQKDWERQERAYREMIQRMPKGDPILPELLDALGEIYRSRLVQYDRAIQAFEAAHELDPAGRPERVQILAELYARVGKAAGEQVAERAARLVEADPSNPDTYRALGRACLEAGRKDEAWCVCRALVVLKQATPAEEELYRRHQEHERRKANGVLDEDTWQLVRDPEEDRVLSSIFALTWEGPVSLRSGSRKSFELKDRDKLKVEGDTRPMSKIFQNAARVLGAPLPHVYVQPERSGRLLLANCLDGKRLAPTLIVGRDLMAGYRDTEVAFSVASTMALLRPAYYLRLALPALEELEAVVAAAAALGGKQVAARPEIAPLVEAFGAEIKRRLTPHSAELLAELFGRLSKRPDLARWRQSVDTTARRAGLLICGELAAATSMVASEPIPPGGPRPADRIRDLVVYSVSPRYFAARRHLGVSVL